MWHRCHTYVPGSVQPIWTVAFPLNTAATHHRNSSCNLPIRFPNKNWANFGSWKKWKKNKNWAPFYGYQFFTNFIPQLGSWSLESPLGLSFDGTPVETCCRPRTGSHAGSIWLSGWNLFWPPVQSMKFKSSAKKLYGDFTGIWIDITSMNPDQQTNHWLNWLDSKIVY